MKFYKFGPLFFVLTFVLGYVLTPSQKVEHQAVDPPVLLIADHYPAPDNIAPPALQEQEVFPEDEDFETLYSRRFRIKLLETGEGFHGDEVNARSGENWLGLFNENGKYSLRSTKITVRRVFDDILDHEKTGKLTGKSVFAGKSEPVFLLKGAKGLSEGPVTTLFRLLPYEERQDEDSVSIYEDSASIRPGYIKDFTIGQTTYTLTARSGRTPSGQATMALLLESGGISQVINTVPDFEGNYLGSLEWAGDLDRDGKLDLYINLYIHDNVGYRNLFLSSPAKKGKLVEKIAFFWTTGC